MVTRWPSTRRAGPHALLPGLGGQVEARQGHQGAVPFVGVHDAHHRVHSLQGEVPVPHALLAVVVGQSPPGVLDGSIGLHDEGAEVVVLGALRGALGHEVGREELARGEHRRRLAGLCLAAGRAREVVLAEGVEPDEEGRVGIAPHVVEEGGFAPADVELLEDHVPHGLGERSVRAGVDPQPVVGELRVVGEVGGDHHDFLAVVARLGHEMRVGGAGEGDVGAPHDQVLGVEPVAGFGNVGLVAEDLRTGRGEVGVPVVEGEQRRPDQGVEARSRAVGDHRHRGDDGESRASVGAEGLQRVNVGGRDDLGGLLPAHADHAAASPLGFVGA